MIPLLKLILHTIYCIIAFKRELSYHKIMVNIRKFKLKKLLGLICNMNKAKISHIFISIAYSIIPIALYYN